MGVVAGKRLALQFARLALVVSLGATVFLVGQKPALAIVDGRCDVEAVLQQVQPGGEIEFPPVTITTYTDIDYGLSATCSTREGFQIQYMKAELRKIFINQLGFYEAAVLDWCSISQAEFAYVSWTRICPTYRVTDDNAEWYVVLAQLQVLYHGKPFVTQDWVEFVPGTLETPILATGAWHESVDVYGEQVTPAESTQNLTVDREIDYGLLSGCIAVNACETSRVLELWNYSGGSWTMVDSCEFFHNTFSGVQSPCRAIDVPAGDYMVTVNAPWDDARWPVDFYAFSAF